MGKLPFQLLIMTTILLGQNAWGWGNKGHKVVARIAEKNLTSEAQQEIKKILEGDSLTKVSVKADIIKFYPKWKFTKPWHYINISDEQVDSDAGDVVTAIKQMVGILKDEKSNLIDKKLALTFLVHFVGDIHQPLHVGIQDDRGGNAIKISFEGKETNLHALWDNVLINTQVLMNYSEYADYLETISSKVKIEERTEFPYQLAVEECAQAHKSVYDFRQNPKDGPIQLDIEYFKRNKELMDIQLLKGGKRLAILLNHLFKK